MNALTKEDLREELQRFCQAELKAELQAITAHLEASVLKGLQPLVAERRHVAGGLFEFAPNSVASSEEPVKSSDAVFSDLAEEEKAMQAPAGGSEGEEVPYLFPRTLRLSSIAREDPGGPSSDPVPNTKATFKGTMLEKIIGSQKRSSADVAKSAVLKTSEALITKSVSGAPQYADSLSAEAETEARDGAAAAQPVRHSRVQVRLLADVVRLSLESQSFDVVMAFVIVLNAVFMGMQTNFLASELTDELPHEYVVSSWIFAAIFTMEVSFRVLVQPVQFFIGSDWKWNTFDFFVVVMQNLEEVLTYATLSGSTSFLRSVRLLRLARILRIVRVLRLIHELRTIISSIIGALKHVLWTVVLLLLIIYAVSVYLTQAVVNYRMEKAEINDDLYFFFGSLSKTVSTLFEAITGGIDWYSFARPLGSEVDSLSQIMVCGYIAFVTFAVLNSVTGVFVESATRMAKKENELLLVDLATKVLAKADVDGNGQITWEEFQLCLEHDEMQMYFEALDIDMEEAGALFKLLDVDGSGTISYPEFLAGCFRLRGPCKALEFATFLIVFNNHQDKLDRRWKRLESVTRYIVTMIEKQAPPKFVWAHMPPPALEIGSPHLYDCPRALDKSPKVTSQKVQLPETNGTRCTSRSAAMLKGHEKEEGDSKFSVDLEDASKVRLPPSSQWRQQSSPQEHFASAVPFLPIAAGRKDPLPRAPAQHVPREVLPQDEGADQAYVKPSSALKDAALTEDTSCSFTMRDSLLREVVPSKKPEVCALAPEESPPVPQQR